MVNPNVKFSTYHKMSQKAEDNEKITNKSCVSMVSTCINEMLNW